MRIEIAFQSAFLIITIFYFLNFTVSNFYINLMSEKDFNYIG